MTQAARVLWSDVGRAPSPAAGPLAGACQQADEASAAVQGDRPTKPMPERSHNWSFYIFRPSDGRCESGGAAGETACQANTIQSALGAPCSTDLLAQGVE